jgi:hypothetical protein
LVISILRSGLPFSLVANLALYRDHNNNNDENVKTLWISTSVLR